MNNSVLPILMSCLKIQFPVCWCIDKIRRLFGRLFCDSDLYKKDWFQ